MKLNLYEVCYEEQEDDNYFDQSQLYWAESHQEAYELWAKDYRDNNLDPEGEFPEEVMGWVNDSFSHVNLVPTDKPQKGWVPVVDQKLKEQLVLIPTDL